MADSLALRDFWKSFTDMKKKLIRNISILSLIMLPLTYQVISVEFFVEEELSGACNRSGRCLHTAFSIFNGTRTKSIKISPYFKSDFEKYGTMLVTSHFASMLLGALTLGVVADRYGRRKVLFSCLALIFFASLLSGIFIKLVSVFISFRIAAGFFSGGSLLTLFVLAAEYVNPGQRPMVLAIIWAASTLACVSFAGLAYLIENRQALVVTFTLPLFLILFIYNFVPESPHWNLRNTYEDAPENSDEDESQKLLHKFVSETTQELPVGCCSCDSISKRTRCFYFLLRREYCKKVTVLGLAWFAIGMLYRGLNTSSIQLLGNFYSNYAVREMVNLLAFACTVALTTRVGRRFTTLLGMTLCGVICIIFSFASESFLLSEHRSITIVVQFVGRFFVVLSITSLSLYSIELFPTIIRCSALGLVVSCSFLGAALTPLIMDLQSFSPTIPLAILGSFSILMGILTRGFLPETKGSLTAETLEDTVVGRRKPYNASWSPRINMTRKQSSDDSVDENNWEISRHAASSSVNIENSEDRFKDLRNSWEVSFDRASRTSKWEWLSYEDAKRKLPGLDVELSLEDESQILDDIDREKISSSVPANAWILIYSTYVHGISLKTLYHRLGEIETPVLLAIKDNQGYIFGVFSPTPPRIKPGFFGYGKSFFFTCKPRFKIYKCSGKNEYYLSCDTDSMAFGCSDGTFGLWLDNELYRGRSTACETYNSEVLSSSEDFVVLGLEAWTLA